MTKILISPGYGAGWSTWADGEAKKFILTYQPFIDILESGGTITQEDVDKLETVLEDIEGYAYVSGNAFQLEVVEVDGFFIIHEYDGSESLRNPHTDPDGWEF